MNIHFCNISRNGANGLTRLLTLACLCLLPVLSANAAIHACKLADGTVTFQDSTCAVIPKATKKNARPTEKIPFSIDASWFNRPPIVPDRAVCTSAGCHCGMYSRKFKSGLPLAIADALYLDGSWHRLESTLLQLEMPDKNSFEREDLLNERDEAACNILMSQKILRVFGAEVVQALHQKKRYAEDMGLDDPADCEAGDSTVCDYTDMITLYERVQGDIKALRGNSRLSDDEQTLESAENVLP